jgi:voltage-gated potassium channel
MIWRQELEQFRANKGLQRWAKPMDPILLVGAFLFILALALPQLVALPRHVILALDAIDVIVWSVFAVDYVARVYLALNRKNWVLTHIPNLLIVILPALRVFVLLRVVMLSLNALNRARQTRSVPLVVAVLVALALSLVGAAVAALIAEQQSPQASIESFPDSLWWAATTVSTVGYGDFSPVTWEGRLVAVFLMFVGIALFSFFTAVISTWLLSGRRKREGQGETEKINELEARLSSQLVEIRTELRALRSTDQ